MLSCTNDSIVETFDNNIETITTILFETTETTLPEVTKPVVFDENITFTCEYISDDETMPYALYTPSTAEDYESIPLIVWLHGSGERGVGEKVFLSNGLPVTLKSWILEGFNAYVLCPQLTGKWNTDSWNNAKSKENLQTLIDKFIEEHNVDADNVVITGHSLGGQGALYMAHQLPEYFSKVVVLSGYHPRIDISEITVPTIGYVGLSNTGEDHASIYFMHGDFADVFGEENVFDVESSHGQLPFFAFNEDRDNNYRSDIIEWMLLN